jgi:hypothetical protein
LIAARASEPASLTALTTRVHQAVARGDLATLRAIYRATWGAEAAPTRVLASVPSLGREAVREWFEAWDDAIHEVWLGDGASEEAIRELLVPSASGFAYGALLLQGMFLREAGSRRACTRTSPWPAARAPFGVQARALGHCIARCDGAAPVDYEAVARALDARLLPAFVTWFTGCFLVSPLESLDARVLQAREAAIAAFVRHHANEPANTPYLLVLGTGAFAATAMTDEPRSFLTTLNDRVLAPAMARAASSRRDKLAAVPRQPAPPTSMEATAVVLSKFNEGSAVQRCMASLVEPMRTGGARPCVLLEPGSVVDRAVPAEWRNGPRPLELLDGASPDGLLEAARAIRAGRSDFLFYPEVGLTLATRWLATQRLARVQAAGYGHPVTTGSDAIDYFVGGASVEPPDASYRERLVLLPGLGVTSTAPPAPSGPRARPVDARPAMIVSLASYNKLTPALLDAWNAILRAAGQGAELHLVPGLPDARVERVASAMAPHLTCGDVVLTPSMPRQGCIDLLAEADVYLDSFPFGGYNTLVEALASGCPVVTLEGRTAPGRFGAALVRALDLPEWLVAATPEAYVRAATRLATDTGARADIRAMLSRERVLATICRDDMGAHFAAAVEWMRRAGPRRPGPPVYVEAGERPRVMDR